MFDEDDLLPLSALQHLVFCERQCALIHVERQWEENQRTAEGAVVHDRVDEGYRAFRRGLKQFTGVPVRSLSLGIAGRLDVLELTRLADTPDTCGFFNLRGAWSIEPVEFKRGRPKTHDADLVQVCAQALCLEEMTGQPVETGWLFYAQLRRRHLVSISDELRRRTRALVARLHEVIGQGVLPPPVLKRHCRSCSLEPLCQPRLQSGARTLAYRKELLE